MCQRVTKMDTLRAKASQSPVLGFDDYILDSPARRRRRTISFRKHVSEHSAQSVSVDKPHISPCKIIGGDWQYS